jgi:hypothetical protein
MPPDGWNEMDFDDSTWPTAVSYGSNADPNTFWYPFVRPTEGDKTGDQRGGNRNGLPAGARDPTCPACVGAIGGGITDEAQWIWTKENLLHNDVYCRATLLPSMAGMAIDLPIPQFHEVPELDRQSLLLRHVRVEANEVFGGGGKELGGAISLITSTCNAEYVDFVGNTQRGVGGGVVYATGSDVTFSFVRFGKNRNLGLGAGVIAAVAGSRVTLSHSLLLENFAENQMGILGTEGACDTSRWPDWSNINGADDYGACGGGMQNGRWQ